MGNCEPIPSAERSGFAHSARFAYSRPMLNRPLRAGAPNGRNWWWLP